MRQSFKPDKPVQSKYVAQEFNPKVEERSNMIGLTHLSNEGIVAKLEEQRFDRLKAAASNLKSMMLCDGRCPLCTLQLPC